MYRRFFYSNLDVVGEAIETQQLEEVDLVPYLVKHIAQYQNRGGAVLFLYAAVLTRGPELIKKELLEGGGEPPLVVGHNWLCTSDLVCLFLCGVAKGNVSAYDPISGELVCLLLHCKTYSVRPIGSEEEVRLVLDFYRM